MTHQTIGLPDDQRFYPLSIAALHAAEGDGIEAGQPVVELLDSSGNSFTIRAQNRGRLLRIFFRAGETVTEPGHRVVEYALTEPAGRIPETRLQIFGIALDRRAGAYPIRIGDIRVKAGDDIVKGSPLWDYEDRNGTPLTAYAAQPGKIFDLRVAPGDIFTEPGHAGVNYVPFDVPATDPTSPLADVPTAAPPGAEQISSLILSRQADHYPVRIREVLVRPGAEFAAGDRLWQMENRTGTFIWSEAPSAGRAVVVHVSPGDIITEPGMAGLDYIRVEPDAASRQATAKAPPRPASPAKPRKSAISSDLGAFDKLPDGRFVFIARYEKRFLAGLAAAAVLICGAAIFSQGGFRWLPNPLEMLADWQTSSSSSGAGTTRPQAGSAPEVVGTADPDRAKKDLDRILAASGPGRTTPNPQQQSDFNSWIDG